MSWGRRRWPDMSWSRRRSTHMSWRRRRSSDASSCAVGSTPATPSSKLSPTRLVAAFDQELVQSDHRLRVRPFLALPVLLSVLEKCAAASSALPRPHHILVPGCLMTEFGFLRMCRLARWGCRRSALRLPLPRSLDRHVLGRRSLPNESSRSPSLRLTVALCLNRFRSLGLAPRDLHH
jgi:hypothetical protein